VRTGSQQRFLILNTYSNLGAGCHALNLLQHLSGDTVLVSEQILNPYESFRAEIFKLRERSVVRVVRWKLRTERASQVFEFGAHRTDDIARLIADVQRYLDQAGGAA
jgi:hypothetical protein